MGSRAGRRVLALEKLLRDPGSGGAQDDSNIVLFALEGLLRGSGAWPALLAWGDVREVAALIVTLRKVVAVYGGPETIHCVRLANLGDGLSRIRFIGYTWGQVLPAYLLGLLEQQAEVGLAPVGASGAAVAGGAAAAAAAGQSAGGATDIAAAAEEAARDGADAAVEAEVDGARGETSTAAVPAMVEATNSEAGRAAAADEPRVEAGRTAAAADGEPDGAASAEGAIGDMAAQAAEGVGGGSSAAAAVAAPIAGRGTAAAGADVGSPASADGSGGGSSARSSGVISGHGASSPTPSLEHAAGDTQAHAPGALGGAGASQPSAPPGLLPLSTALQLDWDDTLACDLQDWLTRAGGCPTPGSPAAAQQGLLSTLALAQWLPRALDLEPGSFCAEKAAEVAWRWVLAVALQCLAAKEAGEEERYRAWTSFLLHDVEVVSRLVGVVTGTVVDKEEEKEMVAAAAAAVEEKGKSAMEGKKEAEEEVVKGKRWGAAGGEEGVGGEVVARVRLCEAVMPLVHDVMEVLGVTWRRPFAVAYVAYVVPPPERIDAIQHTFERFFVGYTGVEVQTQMHPWPAPEAAAAAGGGGGGGGGGTKRPKARLLYNALMGLPAEGAERLAERLPAVLCKYDIQNLRRLVTPAEAVAAAAIAGVMPCGNPDCANLEGASEAVLPRCKTCSRCRAVSYCCGTCQFVHWQAGGHRESCAMATSGVPALHL